MCVSLTGYSLLRTAYEPLLRKKCIYNYCCPAGRGSGEKRRCPERFFPPAFAVLAGQIHGMLAMLFNCFKQAGRPFRLDVPCILGSPSLPIVFSCVPNYNCCTLFP